MQKVLVTGSRGFIGRHVVDLMRRTEQYVVVEFSRSLGDDIRECEHIIKKIRGCHGVVHCAAKVSFHPKDTEEIRAVNFEGTRKVLAAAMVEQGVHNVVFVSSAFTLGVSPEPGRLLKEDDDPAAAIDVVTRPDNPYVHTKRQVEFLAAQYSGHLSVCCVCPTSVYGPGDDRMNTGKTIQSVVKGKVVPVPAGGCNVVDVRDVAHGILAALRHGCRGQRYVLGNYNVSYETLYSLIAEVTGKKPVLVNLRPWMKKPLMTAARILRDPVVTPAVVESTFYWKFYSMAKAYRELGWYPQYNIDVTLRDAWEYYRKAKLI